MTERYRPSNGTEGEIFMEAFCYRCANDDPDNEKYCDILGRTMSCSEDDPDYPTEWIRDEKGPRCTAFRREGEPEIDRDTLPLPGM